MLVLGIESSCDETGAAIVRDGRFLISNVVASQVEIYNRYGVSYLKSPHASSLPRSSGD